MATPLWLAVHAGYVAVTVLHRAAPGPDAAGSPLLDWLRWDAWRYLLIADQGYAAVPEQAAFFPVYPLLYAALDPLLPGDLVALILTLLAHGCPVQAIVAAFGFDERTVAAWRTRAGRHGQAVQEHLVEQPHDLGQVQADEIRVKTQGGIVWMALAMMVSTRLWLAGEVSAQRDEIEVADLGSSPLRRGQDGGLHEGEHRGELLVAEAGAGGGDGRFQPGGRHRGHKRLDLVGASLDRRRGRRAPPEVTEPQPAAVADDDVVLVDLAVPDAGAVQRGDERPQHVGAGGVRRGVGEGRPGRPEHEQGPG